LANVLSFAVSGLVAISFSWCWKAQVRCHHRIIGWSRRAFLFAIAEPFNVPSQRRPALGRKVRDCVLCPNHEKACGRLVVGSSPARRRRGSTVQSQTALRFAPTTLAARPARLFSVCASGQLPNPRPLVTSKIGLWPSSDGTRVLIHQRDR